MKKSNWTALFAAGSAAIIMATVATPSAKITSNPGEDGVFRVLADDLNAKAEFSKDIPLRSRIMLTETTPQGTLESVTMTTEVFAVSQTVLPKSLFELPTDYKQITPPPYNLRL